MILFLSGCTPLQQAPLVYTSTSTLGVGVGLNTTEGPGFDVTLGYKSVDSAYVPVAVSKENLSEVVLIKAERADTSAEAIQIDNTKEQQALSKAQSSYNNFVDANNSAQSSLESNNKIKNDLDQSVLDSQNRLIGLKDELNNQSLQMSDEEKSLLANKINALENKIKTERKQIASQEELIGNLSKNVVSTENNLATAKIALDKAQKEFNEKNPEHKQNNGDDSKYDAYSVYGSFDSKNKLFGGSSSSNETALGKVFSTGVAAQTIAEAERYAAISKCLETLKSILGQIKPEDALGIISTCKVDDD
jgi:uncharacterized coiled-coil protein SlyX